MEDKKEREILTPEEIEAFIRDLELQYQELADSKPSGSRKKPGETD